MHREGEFPVELRNDRLEVNGQPVRGAAKVYAMLNKPRGLVTTTKDEQGRQTVFECLAGQDLPFLAPVGRLDRASEGLLLFTNDTAWAARITDPASGIRKTYHVQIDRVADDGLLRQLREGVLSRGEVLRVHSAEILRQGTGTSWLKIELAEGKNRHIRRMLEAVGINVRRLVRVGIGPLVLGNLAKGQFRQLTRAEVEAAARHTE